MAGEAVKALVVGPAWVGDMVMAQSLLKLLAARHPGIVIDVVAPRASAALAERMPEVRAAWTLGAGHGQLGLAERWRLGRRLRPERYDRAIVLPRSWKAALVPFFAGARQRTGFRTELRYGLVNDRRELDRRRLDQTVKRFLALGLAPGEALPEPPRPALTVDAANAAALRARLGLGEDAVAMMPGAAYGPAKCWPLEHFAAVASALARAGGEVWVLGSAADHAAGERIAAAAPGAVRNLCGETRLVDTVDLLAACRAAVSNDSGLMHVAAAAGTRVVAIYGSSSPAFTPPLTDRATVLYLGLECSPCFQRECPLGHLRCLREIGPERVLEALGAR